MLFQPIHNSQEMKITLMSFLRVELMSNMCNKYYSAVKKNESVKFAAKWLDLEKIILSELTQTPLDQYHMFSLTCDS